MNSCLRYALECVVVGALLAHVGCKREPPRHPVDQVMDRAGEALRLGKLTEARAALDEALNMAPNDADVQLLNAQLAYHAKDYATALQAFSLLASDGVKPVAVRAEALVGYAIVQLTKNEIDKARIALLEALILDRRNVTARYHLGLLYRNLGYEPAAIEQYEAYVALATRDAKSCDRERVERVQRQILPALRETIARKAMERPGASKRDSAVSSASLRAADAAWQKGEWTSARNLYAAAFRADPLSHPAALGLAKAWEKTDTSLSGRRNALSAYQSACVLKPSAFKTLMKTGRLAYELGMAAAAVEAYSRALAVDPRHLEALDMFIRAQRKCGTSRTAASWQGYRDFVAQSRGRK